MKKFKVIVPTTVWVSVEVEVDENEIRNLNQDEIRDLLIDEACNEYSFTLTSYCGNGGNDKLVGVYGGDISIEPSEEANFDEVEIEEVE